MKKKQRTYHNSLDDGNSINDGLLGLEWLPAALLAAVYTAVALALSLKYHTMGGFEVETDFFADFVVTTQRMLDGTLSNRDFGLKGPVYYIMLAGFHLVFGEYFRAGLIMNVLAAGGTVWAMTAIMQRLFGLRIAMLAAVFTISTFAFALYTYLVGTDMVMCLFSFMSMYFLLARPRTTLSLILAGLFACLAFLTRYNAVFLYPAGVLAIVLMDKGSKGLKSALAGSGFFLGSSILFGMPWYAINWHLRGSPIFSGNLIVLKLHYYPHAPDAVEYITSTTGLIMLDPVHFIMVTFYTVINHLWLDFSGLLHAYTGIIIVMGLAALIVLLIQQKIRFAGAQWAWYGFAAFHFAVLALAHYNIRFAFFRIPFYATLAAVPAVHAVDHMTSGRNRASSRAWLYALLIVITAMKFVPTYLENKEYRVSHGEPRYILPFSEVIKQQDVAPDAGVIAKRPHIAYYADFRYVVLPPTVKTIRDVFIYANQQNARFIFITPRVTRAHPDLAFLAAEPKDYPGLSLIAGNEYGFLYRIDQ